MNTNDNNVLTHCDVCGEPILENDPYYHLPDGSDVCYDDHDCIDSWLDEHLRGERL